MGKHVDAVFGPEGKRKALVVAGACGNVGKGKVGQFARLLSRFKVPVVALDLVPKVGDLPRELEEEYSGRFAPDQAALYAGNIQPVEGGIADVPGDIGMVFEAIPERLELKHDFYRAVREQAPDALIGSATSGFTTKALFDGIDGSDRCAVMHPFFPHLTNKLFEVPTDGVTGDDARKTLAGVLGELNLTVVPVRDVPAFAADRIFCGLMLEAVRMHDELGWAPAKVDAACRRVIGAAPFFVHNMIRGSNYLSAHCIELLREEHPSAMFEEPAAWKPYIEDAEAQWEIDRSQAQVTAEEVETARRRVLGLLLGMTAYIMEHDIATPADLNYLCEEALKFPKGLPAIAKQLGAGEAKALVREYCEQRGVENADTVAPESGLDMDDPAWESLYISRTVMDGIGVLSIGRPSINHVYVEEFDRHLAALESDDAVRAIVVGPDGRRNTEFGRGADVGEFVPALGDREKATALAAGWQKTFNRLRTGPKPTVAALLRRSLGGSNEVAMLCTARVAAGGTQIGQPEPSVGVVPGLGGTHTLLRQVKPDNRDWLAARLLTGDPFTAEEAEEAGLVSRICRPQDLFQTVLETAAALADGSMDAPRWEGDGFEYDAPEDVPLQNGSGLALDAEHRDLMRECIAATVRAPFETACGIEADYAGRAFTLPAAEIGVKALLRGKQPDFSGA